MEQSVWVEIEVSRENGETRSFRGRMPADQLQAVVLGNNDRPFVEIWDTHWVNEIWDPITEDAVDLTQVCGRNGLTEYTGRYFLRIDTVVRISVLNERAADALEERGE